MLNSKHKFDLLKRFFVLFCWFILALILGTSFAQQEQFNLLTLENVINLISRVEQETIIEQVERYGVDFKLNDWRTVFRLFEAGAKMPILEAIEKNFYQERQTLTIASPKPGEEVGRIITVKGESRPVEGKFLWIFTHIKDDDLWYPQGGSIKKIKDDGSWERQRVILGREQNDVGLDFEISAIWVDKETNTEIENHITRSREQIGDIKGMQLPKCHPSAEVTVRRAR